MIVLDAFVTSYKKTEDGILHIYFFPGLDDKGNKTARMMFMTKDIDYRYVKNKDDSIDYTIIDSAGNKDIICRLKNISDGTHKDYTFTI